MKLLVGPGVAVAVVIVLSIVFTAALVDLREAALAGELRFAAPDFEASPEHAVTVPDFALPDRFGNVISLSRFSKDRKSVV